MDDISEIKNQQERQHFIRLLFNLVLPSAMEKGIDTRNGKSLGIKLSDEKRDCISYALLTCS